MKIGIIIIFHNSALAIDKSIQKVLYDLKDLTALCLVNNASVDKTLEKLHELNDASGLVYTILDIKQNKGSDAAIRAGVRYLLNQDELRYIGFINIEGINTKQYLFEFLRAVKNYKGLIIKYSLWATKNNKMRRMLFKNVFSVIECLSQKHIGISKLV